MKYLNELKLENAAKGNSCKYISFRKEKEMKDIQRKTAEYQEKMQHRKQQ